MTSLDFGIAATGPFHDTSELHRLEVHEDPEDGFTVLHPPSCEVVIHEYPADGSPVEWTWTDYQCMVSWHVDGVGFDGYRHGFDDPPRCVRSPVGWPSSMPTPWHADDEPLLPGIYTCWVEVVKHRVFDAWGGYEYDSVLHVEPQLALPVGPGWGKAYWTKLDDEGQPTGDRSYLGWAKLL